MKLFLDDSRLSFWQECPFSSVLLLLPFFVNYGDCFFFFFLLNVNVNSIVNVICFVSTYFLGFS
jgi:hypothetical protein